MFDAPSNKGFLTEAEGECLSMKYARCIFVLSLYVGLRVASFGTPYAYQGLSINQLQVSHGPTMPPGPDEPVR